MNKFKLLVAPLLVIPFIASCGGGGSEEYKVSIPDTNGVDVRPGQAYKGKDYSGTIEIATDMIDKQILPDKLDKVTSGNSVLQSTDYTYTLKEDKLTAGFKIPAANIVGDVAIQLTLVDKPDPTTTYTLNFNGSNCLMIDDAGKSVIIRQIQANQTISYHLEATNEGFEIPKKENVAVTYTKSGEKFTDYTYNEADGAISFKMTADVTVTATSYPITPTTQYTITFDGTDCELYLDSEYKTIFEDGDYDENTSFEGYIKPSDGFEYPTDANVKLTSSGKDYDAYEYDDQTGAISFTVDADIDIEATSEESVDYEVTADEYAAAVAFTNVSHLQETIEYNSGGKDVTESTPNISHTKSTSGSSFTRENYVKFESEHYYEVYREEEQGEWTSETDEEIAEFDFLPPAAIGEMITSTLPTFDKVDYNSEDHVYTYVNVGAKKTIEYAIRFENKKLLGFVMTTTPSTTQIPSSDTYAFGYEEITPDWPTQLK